jgi:putative membrane protein
MEQSKTNSPAKSNCNDHLANERTFLAWIRTSIAIIAFGFVIERFSLFMKQMSLILKKSDVAAQVPAQGNSALVGLLLVAFGTLMTLFGFINFTKVQREIEKGNFRKNSFLYFVVAAFIFTVGVVLVIYLAKSFS